MAKNTGERKRVPVKHIRDGIKSNYKKDCKCAICSTDEDLELHHYRTVSTLFYKYCEENNIDISTDEKVVEMRDQFYKDHWDDLVERTVTLCNTHHTLLHSIYGREPALHTASKQERWVQIQKEKIENKAKGIKTKGRFSSLI